MSGVWQETLARLVDTSAPALPALWLSQLWLQLGWGVVLACLGVAWVRGWSRHSGARYGVAAVLMLWTILPGAFSPAYWLGLAFQAPSLAGGVLAGGYLLQMLRGARKQHWHTAPRAFPWIAWVWVLLGWALLFDTLALLPLELYRWGFSPMAAGAFLLLLLLPWLFRAGAVPQDQWTWAALLAVAGCVLLRLPSGNLWDAVLDPWLWVAAHVVMVRAVWSRVRT